MDVEAPDDPNPNGSDELDLAGAVRRAQAGSAEAFESVVDALGDRIWRSALVMCADEEQARDLAQETWLEAWRGLGRFDGRCRFSTWLHGILRHRFLKHLRRRSRKSRIPPPAEPPAPPGDPAQPPPDQEMLRRERRRLARELLDHLPPEQRQVLELRFFADAKLADIAELLDCPPGTVKSRLHHGLRTLRNHPESLNLLRPAGEQGNE